MHGRTNLHRRPQVAHKTNRANRFGTISTQIQTVYQRTVPVPLQKTRSVQAYTVLLSKIEAHHTVLSYSAVAKGNEVKGH